MLEGLGNLLGDWLCPQVVWGWAEGYISHICLLWDPCTFSWSIWLEMGRSGPTFPFLPLCRVLASLRLLWCTKPPGI